MTAPQILREICHRVEISGDDKWWDNSYTDEDMSILNLLLLFILYKILVLHSLTPTQSKTSYPRLSAHPCFNWVKLWTSADGKLINIHTQVGGSLTLYICIYVSTWVSSLSPSLSALHVNALAVNAAGLGWSNRASIHRSGCSSTPTWLVCLLVRLRHSATLHRKHCLFLWSIIRVAIVDI